MFTIKTAAEALCCSEDHIHRLIKDGKLEASDLGRGKHREFRIDEAAIDKMLADTKFVKEVKLPRTRRKLRDAPPELSASALASDFHRRLEAKMKKMGGQF